VTKLKDHAVYDARKEFDISVNRTNFLLKIENAK